MIKAKVGISAMMPISTLLILKIVPLMFHKNNFFLFGLALDYIAHTTTQNGRNIHTKLLFFSINNNTAVTNVMSFADEWSALRHSLQTKR